MPGGAINEVFEVPALLRAGGDAASEDLNDARRVYAQVARRVSMSLLVANAIGGTLVFLLSIYVVPSPRVHDLATLDRLNLIGFSVGIVGGLALGWILSVALARRSSEWLRTGRRPTPEELAAVVGYPKRQALLEAGLWSIALVGFTALNAAYSPALGLECAIELLLGGATTCAIAYLLSERLSRPVVALALERSGGVTPSTHCPGVTSRLGLAWLIGATVPLVALVLVGVTVMADLPASRTQIGLAIVLLGTVGVLVGWFVIATAARALTEPLTALRSSLGQVERGDLSASVEVDDASEIGRLQVGFNRMVTGLRERDRLLDLFGRQVGEEVAREALDRDGVELGGELRDAAVLFVDLIGSTGMAAKLEPHTVVEELNAFFAIVVNCVSLHGGWVNKFEGDAALCVFGAPTSHPDAAGAALATARVLRSRLDSELPGLEAAIGVSAGAVVAGNVGAAERYEYTVIGDPVNEAARLTELAKTTPSRLLASNAAVERARSPERDRWSTGDAVRLRGRDRETVVAVPA
jgi:adenylate cyclase